MRASTGALRCRRRSHPSVHTGSGTREPSRAAAEEGDPHPEEEPQGDPGSGARSLLPARLPRLDHRPHRGARRALEAQPPLLLPLEGGDLRRGARGHAGVLAGAARRARSRRRPDRGDRPLRRGKTRNVAHAARGLAPLRQRDPARCAGDRRFPSRAAEGARRREGGGDRENGSPRGGFARSSRGI